MNASELWLLTGASIVACGVCVCAGYCLGRIDGYWRRAAEEAQ